MPKKEVDYSKTIIYKIVCNDLYVEFVYVGHTTNLNQRRSQHKSACYKENCRKYNYKVYKIIRENGGFDNWVVVEVEKYPCSDFNDATKRERYWVEHFGNHNQRIPSRKQKEYQIDNKEKIQEYKKQYQQDNKKNIAIKSREYYDEHKKERKEYNEKYRENNTEAIELKKKEWYENNKTKVSEYRKVYREKNMDVIKEKKREYYHRVKDKTKVETTCVCGSILQRTSSLAQHQKTKKHLEFLQTNKV